MGCNPVSKLVAGFLSKAVRLLICIPETLRHSPGSIKTQSNLRPASPPPPAAVLCPPCPSFPWPRTLAGCLQQGVCTASFSPSPGTASRGLPLARLPAPSHPGGTGEAGAPARRGSAAAWDEAGKVLLELLCVPLASCGLSSALRYAEQKGEGRQGAAGQGAAPPGCAASRRRRLEARRGSALRPRGQRDTGWGQRGRALPPRGTVRVLGEPRRGAAPALPVPSVPHRGTRPGTGGSGAGPQVPGAGERGEKGSGGGAVPGS